MAYTTTKTTGYGQRVGGAIKGVIVGIIFFLGATGLLWWNEGNFVKNRAALKEAQGAAKELDDIDKLDAANNGQLVHATGPVKTEDVLSDPDFGFSVDNTIRFKREVEYYQWQENKSTSKKTSTGGSETETASYTYKEEWTDKPIISSEFVDPEARTRNANTVLATINELSEQATRVTFGAYTLPKFLIDMIDGATPFNVELSGDMIAKWNKQLAPSAPQPAQPSEAKTEPAEAGAEATETVDVPPVESPRMIHVTGNQVYLGRSPNQPSIGDLRITFTKSPVATVSLVAKVNKETFEQYIAKNDRNVALLSVGTHSMENMFGEAHAGNAFTTWILRGVGIFLVCIGLMLVLAPLQVIASFFPFLGNLVGVGTALFGLLAGLAWSFVIIALAWVFYRPEIGIPLLVVSAVFIWLLVSKIRAIKMARAQAATTPEA